MTYLDKKKQKWNLPPCLSYLIVGLFWLGTSQVSRGQVPTDSINTSTSRIYTYVGKTGFGHEHAIIGKIKEGTLKLGARDQAGKIVFDMSTWQADTPQARQYIGLSGTTSASTQRDVNANMLGDGVLNIRKYPTSTYEISSAALLKQKSSSGKPLYQLNGKFTLHGVTRKLNIIAEVTDNKTSYHLRGSFAILQSHYGITPFSKAFGAVGVTDELKIYGEIDIAR